MLSFSSALLLLSYIHFYFPCYTKGEKNLLYCYWSCHNQSNNGSQFVKRIKMVRLKFASSHHLSRNYLKNIRDS